IGVLFSNLGEQECSHTRACTTSKRVGNLETLEAIARFCFLSYNIQDGIDQFSSLSVVSLGPVVSSSSLAKDKVIGAEELAKRSSTDRVHSSRLQVHKHGTWHVLSSLGFIVVYVDPLQLKIVSSLIGAGGMDSMFIRDHFPKLSCKRFARAGRGIFCIPLLRSGYRTVQLERERFLALCVSVVWGLLFVVRGGCDTEWKYKR